MISLATFTPTWIGPETAPCWDCFPADLGLQICGFPKPFLHLLALVLIEKSPLSTPSFPQRPWAHLPSVPSLQLCLPQHSAWGSLSPVLGKCHLGFRLPLSPRALSCRVCRGSRPEPLPTITRAIPPTPDPGAASQNPFHSGHPPLIPSAAFFFSDLPHSPQTLLKETKGYQTLSLKCLVLDHPLFPPQ